MSIEPIFQVKLLVSPNATSDQPFVIRPNKVSSQQNGGTPQPIVADVPDKSLGVIFCGGDRLSQPEVLRAVMVRAVTSASVSNGDTSFGNS